MKYLFEDRAEDVLSQLYCNSLPENIKNEVIFAQGNGNLVKIAENMLMTGEQVVVILDTVPANKSIRDIYINLRKLSKDNNYRLVVWNIVCAEYYFIKAFGQRKDLHAFVSCADLDIVLKEDPYKTSFLLVTEEDKRFAKTFEKFCKLYIAKNGGNCANADKTFYLQACKNDKCSKLTLFDKSMIYRKTFDFLLEQNYNSEQFWEIHRSLLNHVNGVIQKFNDAGYLKINLYPIIK